VAYWLTGRNGQMTKTPLSLLQSLSSNMGEVMLLLQKIRIELLKGRDHNTCLQLLPLFALHLVTLPIIQGAAHVSSTWISVNSQTT
jgi:hypothetical protein